MQVVAELLQYGPQIAAGVQAQGWGHHMRWGSTGGWGSGIMMLVWTLLLVALIYFLIRGVSAASEGVPPANGNSAIDILKRRYANGELSREEFQQMKKDLE